MNKLLEYLRKKKSKIITLIAIYTILKFCVIYTTDPRDDDIPEKLINTLLKVCFIEPADYHQKLIKPLQLSVESRQT